MPAFRLRALAVIVLMSGVYCALLFGSAGRLDLPMFWALMGLWFGTMLINVLTIDGELLKERMKPGPGVKERWFRPVLILLYLGLFATAGLDVGRLYYSDSVPPALQLAGLVGVAAVMIVAIRAQKANPYFSSAVRIQKDRGQQVVSWGPYRWVRHPGYAAFIWMPVGTGLALGSWTSAAFLVPVAAVIVARTVLEDRALHAELPGYEAYARRVRYRLLPGVW